MADLITQFRDFIKNQQDRFPSEIVSRNLFIEGFSKSVSVVNGAPIIPNLFKNDDFPSLAKTFNEIYPDSIVPPITILKTGEGEDVPITNEKIIEVLKECRDFRNINDEIWDKNEIINALKVCAESQEQLELPLYNEILFAASCPPIETGPIAERAIISEPEIEVEDFNYSSSTDSSEPIDDISLEDSLLFIDDLTEKLKSPRKYKVFSNIVGIVENISSGDVFEWGEEVLRVNNNTIPTFFNQSRIIEMGVKVGDDISIGDLLYVAEEIGEEVLQIEMRDIKTKIVEANKLPDLQESYEEAERKLPVYSLIYEILERRFNLIDEWKKTNTQFTIAQISTLLPKTEYIRQIYIKLSEWTNEIGISNKFLEDINIEGNFDWDINFMPIINEKVESDTGRRKKVGGGYWDLIQELVESIESLEKNEVFQTALTDKKEEIDKKIKRQFSVIKSEILVIADNLARKEFIEKIDIDTVLQDRKKWEEIIQEKTGEIAELQTMINDTKELIENPGLEIDNVPYSIREDSTGKAKIVFYPNIIEDSIEVPEDLEWRSNPRSSTISPQMSDIRWWRKFCNNATIMNLIPVFWPIGLLLPTPAGIVKIPLPIIWRPLKVIQTPFGIIAIGLGICGLAIAPWVCFINTTPIALGPIAGNASWLIAGFRPMKKIKDNHGTKVGPLNAIININGFRININPLISMGLPFIQDDYPPWERLSLKNLPHLLFLTQWCSAGKKSQGFFENPF